jgi:hypothetical protein
LLKQRLIFIEKEKTMKKLIAFTFALLFLSVTGIAAAVDVQISGDYSAQGSYQKNAEGAATDALQSINESGTMYYDHELNLNLNWKIDDNTIIYSQFEMRDEVWGSSNPKEGSTYDPASSPYGDSDGDGVLNANETSNGGDGTTQGAAGVSTQELENYLATTQNNSELDDNVVVEKVYVWHKFANGHQLRLGLMPGGEWGTIFGNAAGDAYRVRYDVKINEDTTILGILQKNTESSSLSTGQGESADSDSYYLGLLTKLGDINVQPVVVYTDGGNTSRALTGIVALKGAFGSIGFETELAVADTNYDASTSTDSRTYGAYANLWYASGPVKAGILGAYGSYDKNAGATNAGVGNGFGGDFDGGGAMIMGYDAGFNGKDNLEAGRLAALYADYSVNDKLSLGGYAGFATCGIDDDGQWDGAKAWEVSADAAYKITDNIVYDLGAGVAQLKYGDTTTDPDKAYRLFNKLTVNF